jgi:hypothetical protein
MRLPPEPDDVDFVVEGGDTDPESIQETIEYVKAYKSRPEHAEEVREAKRILESLGINTNDYGIPDPAELLAHWHRTVAELEGRGLNGSPESEVGSESAESR